MRRCKFCMEVMVNAFGMWEHENGQVWERDCYPLFAHVRDVVDPASPEVLCAHAEVKEGTYEAKE